MTEKLGDMDMQELRRIIEEVVDERLHAKPTSYRQRSDQPVDELISSMLQNIWVPPAGAKSSLELLREDRDA